MNLYELTTRRDTLAACKAAGMSERLADAITKECGPIRHEYRAAATLRVATEWVQLYAAPDSTLVAPEGIAPWDDRVRDQHHLGAAIATVYADLAGIGGRGGVGGDSTRRHPAFASLGTGRKQATDGPAWISAAEALVAREKSPYAGDGFRAAMLGHEAVLEFRWGGTRTRVDLVLTVPWARTIAREGLRRHLGLDPWFPDLPVEVEESGIFWIALAQRLEDEMAVIDTEHPEPTT